MTAAQAPDIEAVIRDALHNTPGVECSHVNYRQPECERDAAHVAAAVLAAGFVRPEDVAEAQAKAWDEGYIARLGDTPRYARPDEWGNPYRAAALRPVDAPEGGA